jgi:hypothetical protein
MRGLFLFLFLLPDADLFFRPFDFRLYMSARWANAQSPFGGWGCPDAAYVTFDVFAPGALLHDGALLNLELGHTPPPSAGLEAASYYAVAARFRFRTRIEEVGPFRILEFFPGFGPHNEEGPPYTALGP